MKTLIFAGSTRQQSFNRQLARAAADMATAAGAQVTLLELGGVDIPLYNPGLRTLGTPPEVLRLNRLRRVRRRLHDAVSRSGQLRKSIALRASCAASHSHAGPHRARNEPSGGVNEIRNTTGLSSTIVEPHRHD